MAIVKGTNQTETIDKSDGTTDDNDVIFGLGGHDVIIAFGGDDLIKGGGGADTIHGGDGVDTAAYTLSEEGVSVSLSTGKGSGGEAEGDTLFFIENLAGSRHADRLYGNNDANRLEGMDGADTLKGFGAADRLYGGRGDDFLSGGDGDDRLDGGEGADVMFGGEGDDKYYVDHVNDVVNELPGQGDDKVWLLGDIPTYVLPEGVEDLVALGSTGELYGNSGDNWIAGNDVTNDIAGGGGRDILYGDGGADAFIWSLITDTGTTIASADTLADFDDAEGDQIYVSHIDADVYAAGNQAFTFIGQAAFSGTPGEINYYHYDGATYIQLQTGESPDVEGVIRLVGIHDPEASWFYL